ncbi:Protein disulfide isomerase-like 1-6 [Striga hermonthica]|uniref:protein disulfide-isomerase n=1 Tax=Striga hermonthica TaxID=68872 RepID=A0A9N7RNF9_STRHE|nr:Protein disulfide isomerase-like 1-6 [Striga hermonthica]
MQHPKSESDIASLAASSPSRSPKRAMYYVQSPSRDSHDGDKSSMHATPNFASPVESPYHPSSGRHSRNSSGSRFSGIFRSSSGRKVAGKRNDKGWPECNVIVEEGQYDEFGDEKAYTRRCQALMAVCGFFLLFTVFCLIIWGAGRPFKPEVAVRSLTVNNMYIGSGSDFSGVQTRMLTVNSSLKISVYNPATFYGIHVSATPVNLVYSDVVVATGQLRKYYQHRKSQKIVLVHIEGAKVPLYGAGESLVTTNNAVKVPLTLEFQITSRGDVVGKLVRTKHRKRVSCPLGPEYGEFTKAATADDEIQFVETSSTEVAEVLYPVGKLDKPFFGLVKSEPEKYTSLDGNLTSDRILHFLENNKFPLVTVMTELNSAKVFSSTNKRQVYVFAEADDLKKLTESLQEVAKKFKSEILLVAVDIQEENLAKPFLTLFGLEDSEETVVVAFDYKYNSKYLLESDPTSRNIEGFCSGLVKGTLSPYYKSQPIPDNKNASILTVVGKTFDDLVLNSPKNILLEVHTPWCITCEATSKKVEKLAKHFNGLEDLVFARIDASTNEHPKLQVEDYPTLLFYPATKSDPIKLPTKSGVKDLASLINKKLKSQDRSANDEL